MNKLVWLIFIFAAILFTSDNTSAGYIGVVPPDDGGDWTIDEFTYVWDETI